MPSASPRYSIGVVIGVLLLTGPVVVSASSSRMIQLDNTTLTGVGVDGKRRTEPYWELEIDRTMAVQFSSEDSVAKCESLLASGYENCTLFVPPCNAMEIATKRPVPYRLQIYPARCSEASNGTTPSWMVVSNTPGNEKTIPVR